MSYSSKLILITLFLPFMAHAESLQSFLTSFSAFLNVRVIPFLIGIAFLFFAYNAIKFFVFESSNEEGREKAKKLAIYSIFAMVLIIIFWGIINLLVKSLGFGGVVIDPYSNSDYINSNLEQ